MQKMKLATLILFLAAYLSFGNVTQAAQHKRAKGPDYLEIVKAYAGAMIKDGRDTYGTKHSPLFASALDRRTMRIDVFEGIVGVREGDRTFGGANPQEETDLYAILYRLTELSGDKRYANEADKALEFFFSHCQSPVTGLMTWGEHLYWDFGQEAMGGDDFAHEIKGEWPFWDECYRLAPEACWKFAIGQWDHQIADKKTGDFSRHAKWSSHGPQTGADFPRYAGQMIANWTDAYVRKENKGMSRRTELVTAISLMVARMEGNMKTPTGYLLAGTDESHHEISWPTHNLELARCLWNSAPHMPGKLAERMKKLALKQDMDFHRMPHTINDGGGFVATIDVNTGLPRSRSMNRPYTTTWTSNYGQGIHASRANRCFTRFEQIEKSHPALAEKYKQLILSAANLYLTATPEANALVKSGTIASVITLMLNTHSLTGEKKYLDRADYFGQLGVKLFLDDGLGLPKATNQHDHYETITGGPGFMGALLKLHEALDKFVDAGGLQDIIFAVREHGDDGHWYANFGYFATDSNKKTYKAGGKLCRLNVTTKKLTILIDDPMGGVRDPVVHYDGKKILFSWRKTGMEYYHLYEINADGSGLRQLTDGPYDDLEPIYLPDDEIMFVSSRCNRWVQCWSVQVATIYRCDKNGKNIRKISSNIEQDNTPWVMPDGRIMYTRWEYIDRSRTNFHHLWFMNPDGIGQMVMYGNMHPRNLFIDAKPVPGTANRIVMVNSPDHGRKEHAGWISIVRTDQGPDMIKSERIISKSKGFRDPFPLSLNSILVAQNSRILLMDGNGDTSEVYNNPDGTWVHEPRPLMPRKREPVIPSKVNHSDPTGKLVLIDAYTGRNMEGIAKGEIKKLLILENLPKPINFSGWMEPITYGGSFTINRIVGTVPVESDGSAYMELPALRSLQLVALDKDDQSVKRMQSFLTVMPGELTTCIGCHEDRTTIAPNTRRVQALKRPASRPKPVSDVPEIFDYPRDIQPIWDKHCLKCHDVDKRKGGVLMTGDMGPIYTHSYFTLSSRLQIADGRDLARGNYAPHQLGSSSSSLMDKINGSHNEVKVTARELKLVKFWIESSATFAGTYASLGTGMIGAYGKNANWPDRNWPSTKNAGLAIKKRCASCHTGNKTLPLSPSDDIGLGTGIAGYGKDWTEMNPPWVKEYGDGTDRVGSAEWMKKYASPKLRYSRHIVYNLSRPDKSLLLLAPLSKNAGGYGICKYVFANTGDADYKALLTAIRQASRYLKKITRFSMKGFKPSPHYIREMKRYGILPQSHDINDPIDVYETDRKYWESMWYSETAK